VERPIFVRGTRNRTTKAARNVRKEIRSKKTTRCSATDILLLPSESQAPDEKKNPRRGVTEMLRQIEENRVEDAFQNGKNVCRQNKQEAQIEKREPWTAISPGKKHK